MKEGGRYKENESNGVNERRFEIKEKGKKNERSHPLSSPLEERQRQIVVVVVCLKK